MATCHMTASQTCSWKVCRKMTAPSFQWEPTEQKHTDTSATKLRRLGSSHAGGESDPITTAPRAEPEDPQEFSDQKSGQKTTAMPSTEWPSIRSRLVMARVSTPKIPGTLCLSRKKIQVGTQGCFGLGGHIFFQCILSASPLLLFVESWLPLKDVFWQSPALDFARLLF